MLKDIPKNIFSSFNEDIWPQLRRRGSECPHIRLPFDTIPDQRIFVYRYLDDDFLSLVRKKPSLQARRQILKASLKGIAALHDQDVVHLGKYLNLARQIRAPINPQTMQKLILHQISSRTHHGQLPQSRSRGGCD